MTKDQQTTPMTKSEMLCEFSKRYNLDGDILRCKACKRGQHFSYENDEFKHAVDCKNELPSTFKKPWVQLKHLLEWEG